MTKTAHPTTKLSGQEPINAFLADLWPYFLNRPIFYADIGAYTGKTYEALVKAGFAVNRALLVEANPTTFATLNETVATLGKAERARVINVALSNAPGRATLRNMGTMSRVLRIQPEANLESGASEAPPEDESTDDGMASAIEVETQTFDNLVSLLPDGHVSLMKVDVEGHELAVLEGAAKTLARQGIDVLYIEAGMDRDNPQQTWYRDIEDALNLHGYQLFRIYEQKQDWIEDRPVLRRINMAFFSPRMIERHPVRLMKEMADLHDKIEVLKTQVAEKHALNEGTEARLAEAERAHAEEITTVKAERDKAIAEAERAHAEEIETVRAERDEAIAEAERAHEEEIETVRAERDEAIAEAERAHAEEIETVRAERDEAIAEAERAHAEKIETVKVERDLAISEAKAATKARENDAVKHAKAIEATKAGRDLAISEAVSKARNKAATEHTKAREKIAAEQAKAKKEWFHEMAEITHRLAAIESSTSWKLTAPLRRVVDRLRHR